MDASSSKILEQLRDYGNDEDDKNAFQNDDLDNNNSDNELLPPTNEFELNFDDKNLTTTETVLTSSAEYKRKHFSNTSSDSDSDSDSITRGLELRNIPVIATIEPQSISSNVHHIESGSLSPQSTYDITSSKTNKSSQKQRSKAYESEDEISDFEFLEKDDLNK